MRFGVSAKVFLAYAVLLLAFAATSAFSVAYLHSARQQVVAHNDFLEFQSQIEATWGQIEVFEQFGRTHPRLAGTYFARAGLGLEEARRRLEDFLQRDSRQPRHADFERYVSRIGELEQRNRDTAAALPLIFKDKGDEFDARLAAFRSELDIFRHQLRADAVRVAEGLRAQGEAAAKAAIFLGVAGLLGAMGAALSLWRTLRPLRELRLRARQIASGEYGQRVGLRSRDEIGDLAREFDAMAQALEEREQRLIRSERLATVGKIAAQITHEIRNPLASIGLNAELIDDELRPEQTEARRLLGVVSGEVDRLSEITESYLRFVRLPRPVLEAEDPAALVMSVMEFARAELAQAGIALELEVPRGLPEIAADENQIRQALLNLLRNAREAMPKGGRLRVAVSEEEDRVTVRVTDSGAGIAADHVERIFEPFFSTKAKGTGLGLALVQQIVTEHGGRIEVSSPPGAGTTFALGFPALPRRAAPVEKEPPVAPVPLAALAPPHRS